MASSLSCKRLLSLSRHLSTTAAAAAGESSTTTTTLSLSAAKSKLRRERDPSRALSILWSISPCWKSKPSYAFAVGSTIKLLTSSRRFSDVESLVESVKPQLLENPSVLLPPVILSLSHPQLLPIARRLFDTSPSLPTFNALLSSSLRSNSPSTVPHLFSHIPSLHPSIQPDHVSYAILLHYHCQSADPESALRLIDQLPPSPVSYTTVLDALYRKKLTPQAHLLWSQMRDRCAPLDVPAFNVRIAHEPNPDNVLAFFHEMRQLGLQPDVISYNYLVIRLLEEKRVEDAIGVYKGLRGNGCTANLTTYRVLVKGLCENGCLDEALKVCWGSVKRNKVPEFRIVRGLLEGLVKNSQREAAKSLLVAIKKRFPESFSDAWGKIENQFGLKEDQGEEEKGSLDQAALAS